MDTSKKYIKMCDCPEIQERWDITKARGDFVIDDENPNDILICNGYHDFSDGNKHTWGRTGWLPRQDQVQEMAGIPISAWGLFYGWVFEKDENHREPWQDFTTGEQLWLAFYMYENHQKIWDSKKEQWIKSE